MNKKAQQINRAIEDAVARKSKLVPENFDVPGFVSLAGRHLYNNLGALATRVCEVGSHLGCSLTSTVSHNPQIVSATAIDSFASDEIEERKCKPLFLENIKKWMPKETEFKLIHAESFSFDLKEIQAPIDFYIYDGDHSMISQRRALTHYYPILADEFIFIVDDYNWPEVQEGTQKGIQDCNLEVLFERHLVGGDHDNESWWNGYYVALLKKK